MILKYFDRAFTFLCPSNYNQRMLICFRIVPRNIALDNDTARCVNFCYNCQLFPHFGLPFGVFFSTDKFKPFGGSSICYISHM